MAGSASGPRNFGLFTPVSTNARVSELRLISERQIGYTQASPDSPISKKLALISEREGEDAVLTGGTRSLHRRLLALNIQEPKPAAPARSVAALPGTTPLSA